MIASIIRHCPIPAVSFPTVNASDAHHQASSPQAPGMMPTHHTSQQLGPWYPPAANTTYPAPKAPFSQINNQFPAQHQHGNSNHHNKRPINRRNNRHINCTNNNNHPNFHRNHYSTGGKFNSKPQRQSCPCNRCVQHRHWSNGHNSDDSRKPHVHQQDGRRRSQPGVQRAYNGGGQAHVSQDRTVTFNLHQCYVTVCEPHWPSIWLCRSAGADRSDGTYWGSILCHRIR